MRYDHKLSSDPMDAFFCLWIKRKNRSSKFTPVIMLSGKDITQEEARGYGCAAFIPKTNLGKVMSMTWILLLR